MNGLNKSVLNIHICIFRSNYHFLGVCAYLESLEIKLDLIFILKESFFKIKSDTNFSKLYKYTNNINEINDVNDLFKILSCRNINSITIISPSSQPFNIFRVLKKLNAEIKLVVIEEGIGSYANFRQLLMAQAQELKVQNNTPKLISISTYILKLIFKKLYFINTQKKYWFNFDLNTLNINKQVVLSYKKALDWLSNDECFDIVTKKINLFISSPFVELNYISSSDFEKIILDIRKNFDNDDCFFIKPHPIENSQKYASLKIIPSNLPIEIVIKKLIERKVDIEILSFSSTAIYTLFLFFGIRSNRLVNQDIFYKKMCRKQRFILDKCSNIYII